MNERGVAVATVVVASQKKNVIDISVEGGANSD
jgi:hypothetical protein